MIKNRRSLDFVRLLSLFRQIDKHDDPTCSELQFVWEPVAWIFFHYRIFSVFRVKTMNGWKFFKDFLREVWFRFAKSLKKIADALKPIHDYHFSNNFFVFLWYISYICFISLTLLHFFLRLKVLYVLFYISFLSYSSLISVMFKVLTSKLAFGFGWWLFSGLSTGWFKWNVSKKDLIRSH